MDARQLSVRGGPACSSVVALRRGHSEGHRRGYPVQSMDIMPTVLDWLGLDTPAGLDGASLRALAEGRAAPPRDLFSEIEGSSEPGHWAYWLAPRSDLRSIRRGNHKYIHHVRDGDADELYLLGSASPYETGNLIDADPATAQQMRQALFAQFRIAPHEVACLLLRDDPAGR